LLSTLMMPLTIVHPLRAILRGVAINTGGKRNFHMTPLRATIYPNANLETFNKVVQVKDRIVLVDFYADWCGPCHQLSPILENLTTEPKVSGSGLPIDLVKIDTDSDDGGKLGLKYKVRALPTVVALKNGEPINQFVGALPEPRVQDFLSKL